MEQFYEMKRTIIEKEIDKLTELSKVVKHQAEELSKLLGEAPNYEQHPTQELLRYAELMGSCIIPMRELRYRRKNNCLVSLREMSL